MTLFREPSRLRAAMRLAVSMWPRATAHHLTDDELNQRAWLGWAAAGIAHGIPAHVTRTVWWQLSENERQEANAVAEQVIHEYRIAHAETLPF
jgi:hypothetical protein